MTSFRKTSVFLALLTVLCVPGGHSLAANAPVVSTVATTAPESNSSRYMGDVFLSPGSSRTVEPVLLVPDKEMDAETASRLIEDLRVMGRILEKNTSGIIESVDSQAVTIPRWMLFQNYGTGPAFLFSSPGRARPMYIAGYGALFFIQVDFPLLPPAQTSEETPAKEESDTVWVQTRRSLLEPDAPDLQAVQGAGAPLPYSRERVDALKSVLTETMKHATNIRGLQSSESLTIVVQGTASQADGSAAPTAGAKSTLTLQATKADVDSYAKGENALAQFALTMRSNVSGSSGGPAVSKKAWAEVMSRAGEGAPELASLLQSLNGQAQADNRWSQISRTVFVVPGQDVAAENLMQITEDMAVMCRILDKSVAPVAAFGSIGGPGFNRGSQTQGLYLDGYGALFFIEVGFPLARPAKEQEQFQAQQSSDSLWSQTMDELNGVPPKQSGARVPPYDAQRVENLTSALVKSLRHTTNFRVHQPQDHITLVVTTRCQSGSYVYLGTAKPDVDAFAKGELTLEQFKEKVKVLRLRTGSALPGSGINIF